MLHTSVLAFQDFKQISTNVKNQHQLNHITIFKSHKISYSPNYKHTSTTYKVRHTHNWTTSMNTQHNSDPPSTKHSATTQNNKHTTPQQTYTNKHIMETCNSKSTQDHEITNLHHLEGDANPPQPRSIIIHHLQVKMNNRSATTVTRRAKPLNPCSTTS